MGVSSDLGVSFGLTVTTDSGTALLGVDTLHESCHNNDSPCGVFDAVRSHHLKSNQTLLIPLHRFAVLLFFYSLSQKKNGKCRNKVVQAI